MKIPRDCKAMELAVSLFS